MISELNAQSTQSPAIYSPTIIEDSAVKTPGVHSNSYSIEISNSRYHADRTAVSCSQLKNLLRSPAHFKKALLSGFQESTTSQDFGSAVHLAVLEPLLFAKSIAIWRGGTRRGIIWEKFKEAHRGMIIFNPDDYEHVINVRDAVNRYVLPNDTDTTLGQLLAYGESEKTIFWTDDETGIRCKVRVDNLIPGTVIFDLKTCGDCRPDEFVKFQALKLDYDLQAAMYHSGVRAFTGDILPFCFIAAEDSDPHGVWLHETGPGSQFFENGMEKFRYVLRTLAKSRETDTWPIYQNSYTQLDDIPSYLKFCAPDNRK